MAEPRSLARSLFLGEVHDEAAFPFPRLDHDERKRVDDLIAELRAYCDRNYDARKAEAERWVPDAVLRDLGERGLLGLYVPERFGGQGLSYTGYCKVFEALGQIDSTLSVILGVHQSIGYKGIYLFGSEDQQQRFLPDLASGRKLAAYALTEPKAGSDAFHLETRARPQPDGSYRLDGEKRYIGNGSRAGVLTVFARTDEGKHVALLVESDMEGFEVGERYETMGLAANDLRRLRFRDVRVPPENVLGEEGDGFRIATEILNNGRMSLGAGSIGSVRKLLDMAIEHTQDRQQFGRPLADFELVQQKIAWMASYLYGMEAMAYLTTGMVDRGVTDFRIESAILKVAGTEFIWYAANRAFQLAGGRAYIRDEGYEKILRDIRVFPIFEGANDVLRVFVALEGLDTVARQLEGLRQLDMRRPVRSAAAIARYAGGRIRRRLFPERLSRTHPSLEPHGKAIMHQAQQLRRATENLLRQHGEAVQAQQAQLKRLAHASFETFAQVATLSRVSDVLEEPSASRELGEETFIAEVFCRRAAARAQRWVRQMDGNDDTDMRRVADAVYRRGTYGHSV